MFSDATLRDMACKRPGTLEDMLKVNGVGAAKCRQYGQAFLDVLAGIGQWSGAGPFPGAGYGQPLRFGLFPGKLRWTGGPRQRLPGSGSPARCSRLGRNDCSGLGRRLCAG